MMDFDRKEFVMQRIAQNGGMYQQIMMMQQQMMQLGAMVDQAHGSNEVTDGLVNQFGMQYPGVSPKGVPENNEKDVASESSVTQNARQRVATSTSPR